MKIDFQKNDDALKVVLDGRLDTLTAPDLERFLDEKYDGSCALVFDCEKLSYISSTGLRVLLTAQKKSNGAMKLANVCELVMEVLEMTGFSDIWVIE